MSTTTPVTAAQLLQMPEDGFRYELVEGELRKMSPAGWKHGTIVGILDAIVPPYIRQNSLGRVFGAETGFLLSCDPDTVRAPDLAFIHRDHLPADDPKEAFWPGAPDLAVEVISPGDTLGEVDEKVQSWLKVGPREVWFVNPDWRNVTVYRSRTDIRVLTEADELDGGELLPGFHCRVAELFESA